MLSTDFGSQPVGVVRHSPRSPGTTGSRSSSIGAGGGGARGCAVLGLEPQRERQRRLLGLARLGFARGGGRARAVRRRDRGLASAANASLAPRPGRRSSRRRPSGSRRLYFALFRSGGARVQSPRPRRASSTKNRSPSWIVGVRRGHARRRPPRDPAPARLREFEVVPRAPPRARGRRPQRGGRASFPSGASSLRAPWRRASSFFGGESALRQRGVGLDVVAPRRFGAGGRGPHVAQFRRDAEPRQQGAEAHRRVPHDQIRIHGAGLVLPQ